MPGRKLEQQTVFTHILSEIDGFELFFTKWKVTRNKMDCHKVNAKSQAPSAPSWVIDKFSLKQAQQQVHLTVLSKEKILDFLDTTTIK